MVNTSNRTGSSSKIAKVKSKSKIKPKDVSSASSLPGVQKIKSSLRQTRRLLAKNNLAADVRVETERRLKSLESDLARAEQGRKERTNAARYHKIKFFERQKVCRKIKQIKATIDNSKTPAGDIPDLQKTLQLYRVELNYIIHYPKSKKYISLFPTQSTNGTKDNVTDNTNRQREELKQAIQMAMEKGELEQDPELALSKGERSADAMNWDEESETVQRGGKRGQQKDVKEAKTTYQDAFFEVSDNDSDEDEEIEGH
ncbi:hypothetical protein BU17DRAFT_51737 [Hysterangium stoloniferum]|nr:hypothetical protein BU17DRAFT_51737 [Hysterangium stoloniferum]